MTLSKSPLFGELNNRYEGMRCPGHWSLFETSVRGVVGQQVSVAAARGVQAKLMAACSRPEQKSPVFPLPEQLLALPDELLPMPRTRKQTLRSVCQLFKDSHSEESIDVPALQKLKGIGPWTTAMIEMRGLGHPDVFPRKDLGLVQAAAALGYDEKELERQLEICQPWRSYAANLLWRSLS